MKKNFILWIIISIIVMIVLPWIAVTFVKSDAGMAVSFILFFGVNPIYSMVIGAFAGKDFRHLCSLPVMSAILFLTGAWIFFDMGETAFIIYAVVYLILGVLTMLVSYKISRRSGKKTK